MDYTLKHGQHETREAGMCAMEWVAYLAGEEHSDSPKCVDPALRRFGIRLNDVLPDVLRQRLRPYLARMIGTADDGRTQERLYMMADWAVRVVAPAAQDVSGRKDLGDKLRAVPEVKDKASSRFAQSVCEEVASAATFAAFAASASAATFAAFAADAADAADVAYAACAADAAYAADAADAAYVAYVAYAAYAADAADANACAGARRQMWKQLLPSALDLLERMLGSEVIELPPKKASVYERLMTA